MRPVDDNSFKFAFAKFEGKHKDVMHFLGISKSTFCRFKKRLQLSDSDIDPSIEQEELTVSDQINLHIIRYLNGQVSNKTFLLEMAKIKEHA